MVTRVSFITFLTILLFTVASTSVVMEKVFRNPVLVGYAPLVQATEILKSFFMTPGPNKI